MNVESCIFVETLEYFNKKHGSMKKILLPFDLSDLSKYAFDITEKIATNCGADIEILGIVPAPTDAEFDEYGELRTHTDLDLSELFSAQDVLQDRLTSWAKDFPKVSKVTTKVGHFDEVVLRYAEQNEIDMISLGIPDSEGITDILIDSSAAKIVRNANAPVLTLKCDRSGYEVTDLLLVNDFSHTEKMNLDIIHTLVNALQLTVHLLVVSTPRHFVTTMEAKAHMEQFIANNALDGAKMHVYSDKSIEAGISSFSVETGVDFVAIGTHQRKGVNRIFKGGSIAEKIVNHLWQPILTFKI